MGNNSFDTIEQEINTFVRRVVLTEQRNDKLDRSTYILLGLLHTEGASGVKSIADNLELDISTVSRQAAGMEKKGLIEKIPNPEDGRSYFYQISEDGKQALITNRKARIERIHNVINGWTEEDKSMFAKLLQKYNQAVQEQM